MPARIKKLLHDPGLKITGGHQTMSSQNQKLSNQTKKHTRHSAQWEKFEAKLIFQPDYVSVRP